MLHRFEFFEILARNIFFWLLTLTIFVERLIVVRIDEKFLLIHYQY